MSPPDPVELGQRRPVAGTTPDRDAGQDSASRRPNAFTHVELPIPRDRLLHLGTGASFLYLALVATVAHAVALGRSANGVAAGGFDLVAAVPLLLGVPAACSAFVLALRRRPGRWACRLHGVAMAAGVVVGGAGALIHAAAAGRHGVGLVELFGSRTLAPLTFAAVAAVGWIAAWSDEALGVGRAPQAVVRGVAPAVPGRRALLVLTLLAFVAVGAVVVVDHGRNGWSGLEIVPAVVAGWNGFAVLTTLLGLGASRWMAVYVGTMLGNMVLGFLGVAVHLSTNMAGPPELLLTRMVLDAPLSAPLLFGLLGMLGLLAVAEPAGDPRVLEAAWPPRRPASRP